MIQEPLTNLEKILQEPVFNISGRAPALKRLTVKLVALEPSSLYKPYSGEDRGFRPVTEVYGYTSIVDADGFWPIAEANPFTPIPEGSDESEEDGDWFYSNDETPLAGFYTPEPAPGRYTPPVERARVSDPGLPTFSPDLAYFGDGAGVVASESGLLSLTAPVSTRRLDPILLWLTFLLLLGILGGIGFGYLLTFVSQG